MIWINDLIYDMSIVFAMLCSIDICAMLSMHY